MNTTEVENYPGFPEGIMGPDLMAKFQEQAERFGTEVVYDDVVELELEGPVKRVKLGNGDEHEATRGHLRDRLGVSQARTRRRRRASRATALSWCATCDGVLLPCRRRSRSSAAATRRMEEATFLTRFADKVYVIHRRDSLQASKIMQQRAFDNEKIEFIWNSEVAAHLRRRAVTGSRPASTRSTAPRRTLDLDGLFVAIGNDPRTHLVHGKLDLTPAGHDRRRRPQLASTNLPGVFAAGDVVDPTYRQAVTAAGSGTVAALDAEHYLAALGNENAAEAVIEAEFAVVT